MTNPRFCRCGRRLWSYDEGKVCPECKKIEHRWRLTNKDQFGAYNRRDDLLAKMGFFSYREYLKSQLWKHIRLAQLEAESKCCRCEKKATQVHHRKYTKENLTGRSLEHLASVCGQCHKRAEFKRNGQKRVLRGANRCLPKKKRSQSTS